MTFGPTLLVFTACILGQPQSCKNEVISYPDPKNKLVKDKALCRQLAEFERKHFVENNPGTFWTRFKCIKKPVKTYDV